MSAFLKFGKVTIGIDWVFIKIAIIIPAIALLFSSLIWIAIPILIYISYQTIHEFIHAFAVMIYGGIVDQISLGYPLSYIDFQMLSVEFEKAVYGWGASADIFIMVLISLSLFRGSEITKNSILFWLGILFIIIFIITELLPEHSDLSEYFKRYK